MGCERLFEQPIYVMGSFTFFFAAAPACGLRLVDFLERRADGILIVVHVPMDLADALERRSQCNPIIAARL